MPDALSAALQTDGLIFILCAMFAAGLIYGFAGFGSALVFIPLASIVVTPQVAVGLMAINAFGSATTVLLPAWRQADRARVLWMLFPAVALTVPGIWILTVMDVTPLRWLISIVVGLTLLIIMLGWRRQLAPSRTSLVGLGAAAGLLGGATGLTGPLVILFNLAGKDDVTVTRANTLCFLTLLGLLMIPILVMQGVITLPVMWLGVVALPVYVVAALIGKTLFDPKHEHLFRTLGYIVIGGAMIVGLPIWG